MATLNMRLDDDLEKRMVREANLERRTRSELARAAIENYLAQCERRRFQDEILRAARARGDSEAIAMATEALYTDNESLALPLTAMAEPKARYRAKVSKKKRNKS